MNYQIINLTDKQVEELEKKLDEYDLKHITYRIEGCIQIGIEMDGKVIAGLDACMTAFRILYVSTVFVEEAYRRKGYGKIIIEEMEKKAEALGANIIRLDTFGWQGKAFYESLGYTQVGYYSNEIDMYEEYFFLKRI